MKKRWVMNENDDLNTAPELLKMGLSPVTCRLLISRGICTRKDAENFLNPENHKPNDPWQMPDMKDVIEKLKYYISNNKRIFIYGDYDADGVTSTSILYMCFKKLGVDVHYYIPNRMDEGYGLSIEAIDKILSYGADLIITVDCGISSIEEVSYCKKKGIDIVVTDHHECRDEIPDTLVVNAKRKDSDYPFRELSGAGVALKLVQCLGSIYENIDPNVYLELAAIGTIADVVPLIGENRLIVKSGLERMRSTGNPGIKALMAVSGINNGNLNSGQVAFFMAPRINAAGRIGDASKAVELFTCSDENTSKMLAEEMNAGNGRRQEIEEKILSEAEEMIAGGSALDSVIILKSPGWHIGVIGIVASRLVEKYYKPVIMLSEEDGICKGSGRSIPGFNLFKALSRCSDLLIRFGGHELAAGLTVADEKIEDFKLRMNEIAEKNMPKKAFVPSLNIDCELKEEDISQKLLDEIEMLEPFGMENPSPLFMYRCVKIEDIKAVGRQEKHLSLKLKSINQTFSAIAFNMGYNINSYNKNSYIDAACSLEKENWNGSESIKMVLRDIRHSEFKDIEDNYYRSLKKVIDCIAEGLQYNVQYIGALKSSDESYSDVIDNTAGDSKSVILVSNAWILEKMLDYNVSHDVLLENNRMSDGRPAIIINPDLRSMDFSKIENVYIMDNLVNYNCASMASNIAFDGAVFHLCCDGSVNDIEFIKSMCPSAGELEKIFAFISNHGSGKVYRGSIKNISEGVSMNLLSAYYCINSLREMGAISVYAVHGNELMFKICTNCRVSPESSATIRKFKDIVNNLDNINQYIHQE